MVTLTLVLAPLLAAAVLFTSARAAGRADARLEGMSPMSQAAPTHLPLEPEARPVRHA